MEYKTLIEEINKGRCPSNHSFKLALQEIYLEGETKYAIELTNSLSKYYITHYNGYEGYSNAYSCARNDLDFFAEKADNLFGGKRNIQKFYRSSVNFYKRGKIFLDN